MIRVLLEWHCIWVVTGLPWARSTLLCEILAGQQKHLLVEAADHGNLRLRLLRLGILLSGARGRFLLRIVLLRRRLLGRLGRYSR